MVRHFLRYREGRQNLLHQDNGISLRLAQKSQETQRQNASRLNIDSGLLQ